MHTEPLKKLKNLNFNVPCQVLGLNEKRNKAFKMEEKMSQENVKFA